MTTGSVVTMMDIVHGVATTSIGVLISATVRNQAWWRSDLPVSVLLAG